jgi:hypothetical protein
LIILIIVYYKKVKKIFIVRIFFKDSTFALKSCYKKIGFSLKKVKLKHRSNTCFDKVKDVNILLKECYLTVHKFKIKDIICIDETSLNSFLIRNYNYSKKDVLYKQIVKMFSKSIQEFLL